MSLSRNGLFANAIRRFIQMTLLIALISLAVNHLPQSSESVKHPRVSISFVTTHHRTN